MIDLNKENAARLYYEPEARFLVSLQWTRLIAVAEGVALVIALLIIVSLVKQLRHQQIKFLASSSNGAYVPVSYLDASANRPSQKNLEYFALQFVTKHYSRIRYTIAQDYLDSLQFLDPTHKKAELAREKQEHWIEAFRNTPTTPEIRIVPTKIRFGNCSQAGMCQISVDFDKHFILNGIDQKDKTEDWTADMMYTLLPPDSIDNDMVPVNPIGLSLGDIRESKGFKE
jgi:type IV secretory pathway component VirB8